ncbi:MAG: Cna B-type domain-containing protein, partial [Erysipelotrichales bacterium]|nr:Cna B-type domain-containing protein [Erysipelotrichales bacterium]
KKTAKRILTFIMAALLMISVISPSAVHAETESVNVETSAGCFESVEAETTSVYKDGVRTVLRNAAGYATADGYIVDYRSKQEVYDNGNQTFEDAYTSVSEDGLYEASGGRDSKISYTAPALEVGLVLKAGENNSSQSAAYEASVSGDQRESDKDGIYDYTESSGTSGKVSVTTSSVEVSETHGDVYEDDLSYLKDVQTPNETNNYITDVTPLNDTNPYPFPDGYNYVVLGSDQFSQMFAAWASAKPKEDTETPVYEDENFKLYVWNAYSLFSSTGCIVPRLYLMDKTVEGEYPARWSNVEHFTLEDRSGNRLTTYCADINTNDINGYGYNVSNLEDALYYEEDQAKMIRTVANNGYWGTDSGFGSLEYMKNQLLESGEFTAEELSLLTEGLAMAATQYSIWTFSNVMDGITFVNLYYGNLAAGFNSKNKAVVPDKEITDMFFKLYHYLVNLEPSAISDEDKNTNNTIINEKNFLESVSLTVTGKPKDHANNKDSDTSNDVYTVDFSFDFKVAPAEENGDDLVLKILDAEGNVICTGRVAGDLQTGETKATVDENGRYTLSGIDLEEGKEALSFQLSGTQNLANDVYFFTSEIKGGKESQPMVGVASGSRSVNVKMDVKFELDVDDDREVIDHYYRTEKEYLNIPVTKTWEDEEDYDGLRPESVTVHLLADGKETDEALLSEDNDWAYTFERLAKRNEEGKEILYTVTEDPVEGYETVIDGYKITNTHEPEKTEILVTKIWKDEDNKYLKRPDSVTVRLFADGKEIDTVQITEKTGWMAVFNGLDVYKNGKKIEYTITEDPVREYSVTINGFTVYNTYLPPTGVTDGMMIWIVIGAVAAAALILALILRKKKSE